MKAHYQKVTVPTLFVTKDKHRVKQYENQVIYLKDGDEFELELFNPTSKKVLAKIKLNDEYLDSGIVLRPGERVFLERYLNEARKFIFSTYKVDKIDPNVQRAIKDNGKVEVEFYQEEVNNNIIYLNNLNNLNNNYPNYYGWQNPDPCITNPGIYYSGDTTTLGCADGGHTLTSGADAGNMDVKSFNCSCDINISGSMERGLDANPPLDMQETGRVEKGSNSDQSFEYDSTSFNTWVSWRQSWTILPLSQKAFVKEDIKIFCTECGARRKKDSFKFCPNCGNKY
jgi:hypothetical protein